MLGDIDNVSLLDGDHSVVGEGEVQVVMSVQRDAWERIEGPLIKRGLLL